MMNAPADFSKEQQAYLQGLMMGSDVARKVRGLPILSGSASPGSSATIQLGGNPSSSSLKSHLPKIHLEAQQRFESQGKTLVAEELAKRDKDGLAMWSEIAARSAKNEFPKGTDVFLTKYHGLFFVAPAQNSFMCRMRLPGGIMRSDQLAGIADIADRFAGGYSDITTRANLQLREIGASNAIHVLMGLRELGVVTQGAGADNIRNVTCSTLSGIDDTELIETLPLAKELHYHILHKRELYGLPRKFNIAFDGSGRVSSLAETNDISFHAVRVESNVADASLPAGIYFLLGLGGITGHGDFARPTGVLVEPSQCVPLCEAILRVFIQHGNRTDRKKARLKYLLDEWGFDKFLDAVSDEYGRPLNKVRSSDWVQPDNIDRWAHVGVHAQKQSGRSYVGVVLPVGRLTSDQMRGIAKIASAYGSGQIRLTVWQNLLITDLPTSKISKVQSDLESLGLDWRPSSVRAGLVACTGNAGCKFAASDTKGQAMILAQYLEDRFSLDQPINIHLTGCHHSCAQHAIGDIGLIATKVALTIDEEEEMVEGYHILVGGRTGVNPKIGNKIFDSVTFDKVPARVATLIQYYLEHRDEDESFATFSDRTEWPTSEELLEMAISLPTTLLNPIR
jgi:ferredoxin-nitrite reductase